MFGANESTAFDDGNFIFDSHDRVCFTLFTPKAVHNAHGVVLVFGYSIMTFLVFITNLALLVGLYKTNTTLTVAQRLFVLMSSMDLVIGLVFLPLQIFMITTSKRQNCGLVMIQAFVSMFFPFMSGLVLLLIVIHRFFLVVNTKITKKLAQRRNVRICLLSATIFSASMSTWYVFQKRTENHKAHGSYYLTAGLITSSYLVVITMINIKLVRFLKRASKRGATRTSVSQSRSSYHRRVSKTLVLMSGVITVCYLPIAVSFVVSGYFLLFKYQHMNIVQIIIPWSQMVMTFNSALNSYIYIVRTRTMSNYYKSLLKKYCFVGKKKVQKKSLELRSVAVLRSELRETRRVSHMAYTSDYP